MKLQTLSLIHALITSLRDVIELHDLNTCLHEDVHRGGSIWTICDQCGRRRASGEGSMIDLDRTYYSLFWDDCVSPNGWRIFQVGFSGRSVADSRGWAHRKEAEAALAEFERAVELHEYFCPGCKNTTTRRTV